MCTRCGYDNNFKNFFAASEIKISFHKVVTALLNSCSKCHSFLPSFDVFVGTVRELIAYTSYVLVPVDKAANNFVVV